MGQGAQSEVRKGIGKEASREQGGRALVFSCHTKQTVVVILDKPFATVWIAVACQQGTTGRN